VKRRKGERRLSLDGMPRVFDGEGTGTEAKFIGSLRSCAAESRHGCMYCMYSVCVRVGWKGVDRDNRLERTDRTEGRDKRAYCTPP
jgi:hypothetical protein